MRYSVIFILMLAGLGSTRARADDANPSADVFSYSYLQLDHRSQHSDYFDDRSSGNGLKFSYDFADSVYLFGRYDRLDFDTLSGSPGQPGHHDLYGFGVGAHQQYSDQTSFYVDLGLLRDRLDGGLGGAADNYWRVTYGFRSHMTEYLELDGAIFTERNTDFGRRPFGERLGFGIDGGPVDFIVSGEHTTDGNRVEFSLVWAYR